MTTELREGAMTPVRIVSNGFLVENLVLEIDEAEEKVAEAEDYLAGEVGAGLCDLGSSVKHGSVHLVIETGDEVKDFLREIAEVCLRRGLVFGHEDQHGGFELHRLRDHPTYLDWMLDASDRRSPA